MTIAPNPETIYTAMKRLLRYQHRGNEPVEWNFDSEDSDATQINDYELFRNISIQNDGCSTFTYAHLNTIQSPFVT